MTEQKAKSYKELQLEELKAEYGIDVEPSEKQTVDISGRPEDEEIATLYADAGEYEGELACMEQELELIKETPLNELLSTLCEAFPDEAANYGPQCKAFLLTGWKQLIEKDSAFTESQLSVIEESPIETLVDALQAAAPESGKDFEKVIRDILIQSWQTHIEIKKEHIKEEHSYIKALGLKPNYAKRVYNRYHGIA